MTRAIFFAACAVACAWLFADRPNAVAAVKWQAAIAAPNIAKQQPKFEGRIVLASLPAIEPVELYGPPKPLRRDTKAEMSAVDIAKVDHVAEARAYLVKTARPGFTMSVLGVENSLKCYPPSMAKRLAGAIAEARANGMPDVGIYSAHRPAFLGVGGFKDKMLSLHGGCVAVDIAGLGRPGSKTAIKFWLIAGRWKLINPYGPWHRYEHNHYQGFATKSLTPGHPLRSVITRKGPTSIDALWKIAEPILQAKVFIPKSVKPPARYAKKVTKTRYAHRVKRKHYASAS